MKSTANEIPKAVTQLGRGKGPAYVVLPKSEHQKAREKLEGTGYGLKDYRGNTTKRSSHEPKKPLR